MLLLSAQVSFLWGVSCATPCIGHLDHLSGALRSYGLLIPYACCVRKTHQHLKKEGNIILPLRRRKLYLRMYCKR
jgi:hypothetical protein